jgi:hypothetical protein
MNHIYHLVPRKPVVGQKILPLNRLREIDEELYKYYAKKYEGREFVMEYRIPPLNCIWNDVVFLNAIPPRDLFEAYKITGRTMFKRRFYKIDPAQLDHFQMSVLVYGENNGVETKTFVPFQTSDLKDYSKIPERTMRHYREVSGNNKTGLMFAYVPHILYKGEIDISQVEIVEV